MDTIANMFSQLKNASSIGKEQTEINYSKLNLRILELLKKRGFISDYHENIIKDKKYPGGITVTIKYKPSKEPVMADIVRVSRSGRRLYVSAKEIGLYSRGQVELLISTSQGIMTGYDARKKGLGGEIIGKVVK